MPQVDFYILQGSADAARLKFACRLVEKAWLAGHRVVARVDDAAQLAALDELLWTFADRAFVPHEPLRADGTAEAPIGLQAGPSPAPVGFDLLVNLGTTHPAAADDTWARVAEVVDADENRRRAGRERFRAWRERGIQPTTHNIERETDLGNG